MRGPAMSRDGLRVRLTAFLATGFGMTTLACVLLAGWALWSAGVGDSTAARQVRTGSVYVAPGVDVDRAAAEQIIGNRRLVVLMLPAGADRRGACAEVRRAAAGTLVLVLTPTGDGYDRYACFLINSDDEHFGRAYAAEEIIARGVDAMAGRPLEALKVVVVNYDLLVRVGTIPDGARTVSPALPRYLIAAAAVLAVVIGAAAVWATARRAGRLAAARQVRQDAATDRRKVLDAAVAAVAEQIINLDQRFTPAGRGGRRHETTYRNLAADYSGLLAEAAGRPLDDADLDRLTREVEALSRRCRELAAR